MNTEKKTNVDEAEIQKFDTIAKEWWDPHGPMKPLHQLNPIRLNFILQHQALADKKIIDIGCGAGILTEALAKNGAHAIGLDLSPMALAAAREHAAQEKLSIEYIEEPVESYAKTHSGTFDAVSCMEMLEHVPDPFQIIKACADLIKPNGFVFFSTINRNTKAFLQAIIAAEYILNLLPKGTHHYQKLIRPSELGEWARAAGLSLVEMKGIKYHPFSGKCNLSDNLSVNYLAAFRKNEN